MLIQAVRSLIFYVLFLSYTFVLAVILSTMALFHDGWFPFGSKIVHHWTAANLFFLRWVVGIRADISGMENIPEGGCIVASKHQSDWDIFALMPLVKRPAFIAKKELMDMPFFGRAAKAMDAICIDRKRGGSAIAGMNAEAKAAIERGCQLIIFPEGTRSKALAEGKYKFGTAKLYEALNVPVVPVALNSGLFWPRNSLVLWPGVARARFLPPIPAGLPAAEMHQRMIDAIEAETDRLTLQAVDDGLSAPIDATGRARIEELRLATKA